jgi:ribosomal protein L7/L12
LPAALLPAVRAQKSHEGQPPRGLGALVNRRIRGVYMSEQIAIVAYVLIVGLLAVASQSARPKIIERRLARLASMETKLDILLNHFGLQFDPYKNLPNAVVQALRSGEKIQAIRCYREATGVTLRDAKDFIEQVQRQGG